MGKESRGVGEVVGRGLFMSPTLRDVLCSFVMRYMRWLACTIAPRIYHKCRDDPAREFPDASTFTFVWSAVEDMIMSAWVQHLKRLPLDHLSLHYDGVRIHGGLPADVGKLCKECSDFIAQETGFLVNIKEKKHESAVDAILSHATSTTAIPNIPAVYLAKGNCIVYALRCLVGESGAVDKHLADGSAEDNLRAASRGHRSYASVAALYDTHLLPTYGREIHGAGRYLLHCEPEGRPHCVAVEVLPGAEKCFVFIGSRRIAMTLSSYNAATRNATDANLLVHFEIVPRVQEHAASVHAESLLNLLAGHSDDDQEEPEADYGLVLGEEDVHDQEPDADSDGEDSDADSEREESIVTMGTRLLSLLKLEVKNFFAEPKPYRTTTGRIPCPFCPFRGFGFKHAACRLSQHVTKYHIARLQYCCSGTKQMKIILSLFDSDQQQGLSGDDYLRRSAAIMQKSVLPPLSYLHNKIDRELRLVFTSSGPEYWNNTAVVSGYRVRRVRNLYYTQGFAEILYREMILHSGKVKAMLPRLHLRGLEVGNPLVALYPNHCRHWWPMIEDIYSSPAFERQKAHLQQEMFDHEEFESISIDATLRVCLRLHGQASYRAPAIIRAHAPVNDENSLRKLLTVKGRTGAVVFMEAIREERADYIAQSLMANMPLEVP